MSLLSEVENTVQQILAEADPAHDWEHIQRVRKSAQELGVKSNANLELIDLVALLHEIGDSKIKNGRTIREILTARREYNEDLIGAVERIVPRISFRKSLQQDYVVLTPEEQLVCDCVSDADKLDALGAIGIARVFAYSGATKRPIYRLNEPPRLNYTAEEYEATGGSLTAINHFFEKLLRLDQKMKTPAGIEEAKRRIELMRQFLDVFAEETGIRYPKEAYLNAQETPKIHFDQHTIKIKMKNVGLVPSALSVINKYFSAINVTLVHSNDGSNIVIWLKSDQKHPEIEQVNEIIKEICVFPRQKYYV